VRELGERRLSTLHLAVVEDDESFRESLEGLFVSLGYEVSTYLTAEQFMQTGQLGDIDCLLTDYCLPGISGIDLLRAARAIRPHLPVIVITARNEPSILTRAMAEGAIRVFIKPLNTSELLEAISEVV
jgi:FixJ family two-component response regulator